MYTKSIETLQKLREDLAPLKEIYCRVQLDLFLDGKLMDVKSFDSQEEADRYMDELDAQGSPYTIYYR